MQINDLIFRELLKRGYALEGKTRVWNVADSKLWYLTDKQAQGFLDVEKSQVYKKGVIDVEIMLIKKNLDDIYKRLSKDSYNIIDLGCGDGKKAALCIADLRKRIKLRYCPIDISSYMVKKAASTLRKLKVGEVIDFKWNVSDFENLKNITPLLRQADFNSHFMMLLGNTMGNFNRGDILSEIKNSMKKDDFLLIGNGLLKKSKKQDIIKQYKTKQMQKFPFLMMEQLGLQYNEVKYGVRMMNGRIEMFFTLLKDKTITNLGRSIHFKKGDLIITITSDKYTKPEFKKILSKFFSKIRIYSDPNDTYTLALCQK